jgi:subtilisin family serine protease
MSLTVEQQHLVKFNLSGEPLVELLADVLDADPQPTDDGPWHVVLRRAGRPRARVLVDLGVLIGTLTEVELHRLEAYLTSWTRNEVVRLEPHLLAGPSVQVIPSDLSVSLTSLGMTPGYALMGDGARIAILDTGFPEQHPDVARGLYRPPIVTSFIGASPGDRHGHGSHGAGLAVGTATPGFSTRFSVAPRAQLLVAKVIGDPDDRLVPGDFLCGLAWAAFMRAHVVCAALQFHPTTPPRTLRFVELCIEAFSSSLLVIGAAGNSFDPVNRRGPVVYPAASATALAVGAYEPADRRPWEYSCRPSGLVAGERAVDVVAPGFVEWSWGSPGAGGNDYEQRLGTSTAAAHATGVAALMVERLGKACTGPALKAAIINHAEPCASSCSDSERLGVGAGYMRVP